ncbi:MAG: hypothetical protein U0V74_11125 [Chitinophagales bacterium]
MITPGHAYEASGKFDLPKVIIYTLIGSAFSIGLGLLYGLITEIDPLIYLNLLVLLGTAALLAGITVLVRQGSHSRNTGVNLLVCFILCFTAWYAQWVYYFNMQYEDGILSSLAQPGHVLRFAFDYADGRTISIGRFGSSGLPLSGGALQIIYLIEFCVFMMPIYFAYKVKDFYCEACSVFYSELVGYVDSNEEFGRCVSMASGGDYRFFEKVKIKKGLEALETDPAQKQTVYKLDYRFCPKCGLNSVLEISSATLQYDDKGKRELKDENVLVEDTYVEERTAKIINTGFISPSAAEVLTELTNK